MRLFALGELGSESTGCVKFPQSRARFRILQRISHPHNRTGDAVELVDGAFSQMYDLSFSSCSATAVRFDARTGKPKVHCTLDRWRLRCRRSTNL